MSTVPEPETDYNDPNYQISSRTLAVPLAILVVLIAGGISINVLIGRYL